MKKNKMMAMLLALVIIILISSVVYAEDILNCPGGPGCPGGEIKPEKKNFGVTQKSFSFTDKDEESSNIHYVAVSRSKHKVHFMIYE